MISCAHRRFSRRNRREVTRAIQKNTSEIVVNGCQPVSTAVANVAEEYMPSGNTAAHQLHGCDRPPLRLSPARTSRRRPVPSRPARGREGRSTGFATSPGARSAAVAAADHPERPPGQPRADDRARRNEGERRPTRCRSPSPPRMRRVSRFQFDDEVTNTGVPVAPGPLNRLDDADRREPTEQLLVEHP